MAHNPVWVLEIIFKIKIKEPNLVTLPQYRVVCLDEVQHWAWGEFQPSSARVTQGLCHPQPADRRALVFHILN